MASIDTNRPAVGFSAGNAFVFVVRAFAAIAAWNDARVTRKSLSKLTARELNDIGLSAGDIEMIASRARG